MDKKQIRFNFRTLIKTRHASREMHLARAFLLGVPYHVLEKKSHDQVNWLGVQRECFWILFPKEMRALETEKKKKSQWAYISGDEGEAIAKLNGEEVQHGQIVEWFRRDVDAGKTILLNGWGAAYRQSDGAAAARLQGVSETSSGGGGGVAPEVQHDSDLADEESATSLKAVG